MKNPTHDALLLIALLPEAPLRERIRALKEEMRLRFGAAHALKSPAHLTLQMPFRASSSERAGLVRHLEVFARREPGFEIQLSGFDAFPPRVIFIRVLDHEPIIGLHARLRTILLEEAGLAEETTTREIHPHVTIATRDLSETAFLKAWPEFQARGFEASFRVRSLFLLQHSGKSWEPFREFPFRGAEAPGNSI
ncbi:2'-5' RNA ligase family protein [Robiginitalea marina]|uniref:2'-5' RNA ligase family protein n=1 Tax=Robiginitalea marina TaxID=2954105 RepID=A0ABT1AXS4_9FLAO|nr:2'-5' RNA ligase family protein [Robiginitalea marina]MCO5724447.1 2'-5' RNA ligase family protein [Robiginitalea marina]